MADPTKQYEFALPLGETPLVPQDNPCYDDLAALYNASKILAYQIQLINERLTAAGIP